MQITYELTKANRRMSQRFGPYQSRSFVKAFLQMLFCETSGETESVIDISNTSRSIAGSTEGSLRGSHPGLDAGEDSFTSTSSQTSVYNNVYADDCGIVIGTGSTAVAVADDNLATPIVHGAGSGQMIHYGCWALNYTTGASSSSFDIERIFRNDSGGSIVVAEIGVYIRAGFDTTGGTSESEVVGFCILRDVLGATVTVLNGEYLKVKYTITVSN